MKKFIKALAVMASVSMLALGIFGCSDDGGSSGGEVNPPPDTKTSSHLVKFNATADWGDTVKMSGSGEGYLLFNRQVNIASDNITIESKVNFNSNSGHVGIGFISVDGTKRKGYQLLMCKSIKNESCTGGGSGQGLENKAEGFTECALNTDYNLKVVLSDGKLNYYVYDAAGTTKLADKLNAAVYHVASDIVYPAFGGTNQGAVTYSNMKVTVNGKEYTIDGLDEASSMAAISVDTSILRMLLNEEKTISYTATAVGGTNPGILLDYDSTKITVTDDANGTLKVTGTTPTTGTTITLTNKSNAALKAFVTVVVEDFNAEDAVDLTGKVYPAVNATGAYEDGEIRITFDAPPTLSETGSVSIYKEDGTFVDVILAKDEVITPATTGKAVKVRNQMMRVEGNNVYITLRPGKLGANTKYYVSIPKNVITGKIGGVDFGGLTNVANKASWKFTTRATQAKAATMTVDSSESSTADFRTIQGALNAIGKDDSGTYTINLAAGTYRELVHFNGKANITIAGPSDYVRKDKASSTTKENCVIKWTNNNDWNGSMDTRAAVFIDGTVTLTLKNVTIQNTTKRGVSTDAQEAQAEALYAKSTGNLAAYNCSFKSYQDTICTHSKKAWFYDCYVDGDVDYLWGTSDVCLFEECDFLCLNDEARKTKESILYVARVATKKATKVGKGYVLFNSKVKVEDGIALYFARNATPGDFYDQGALVNVDITITDKTKLKSELYNPKDYTPLAGKEDKIGWKDYGVKVNNEALVRTGATANTPLIPETEYNLEFNGRNAILNRSYSISDEKYVADSSALLWDISTLVADFNASTDASLTNDYGDEAATSVEYLFAPSGGIVTADIQSTTKKVDDILTLDATNGKVGVHQEQYGAYFNDKTNLNITLKGPALILVEVTHFNSGAYLQLFGADNTAISEKIPSAKKTMPFVYTGTGETVVLKNTDQQTYIKTLKVIYGSTDYLFAPSGGIVTADIQSTTKKVDDILTLDATNGKVGVHQEQYGAYFNDKTNLNITLKGPALILVEVTHFNNGANLQLFGADDTELSEKIPSAKETIPFVYTGTGETVVLKNTDQQTYIKTLRIFQ